MLKNVLKNFQMFEQYWGCLDKMSEVNFSPAETLQDTSLFVGILFIMGSGNFVLS